MIHFLAIFMIIFLAPPANADNKCKPSFPDKFNPKTDLCLVYPPPGVSSNSFLIGDGDKAYGGNPLSIYKPGKIIGRTKGFWTRADWEDGSGSIGDSKGKVIKVRLGKKYK